MGDGPCRQMEFVAAADDDELHHRTDHAPENLNIAKKIAMNLLRMNPLQRSLPKKRLNNDCLAEVLGISWVSQRKALKIH